MAWEGMPEAWMACSIPGALAISPAKSGKPLKQKDKKTSFFHKIEAHPLKFRTLALKLLALALIEC
jgi:hypothetical protein